MSDQSNTLYVVIDPSGAQSGASATVNAINSIIQSATQLNISITQTTNNIGQSMQTSANSVSSLQKAIKSLTDDFGRFGALIAAVQPVNMFKSFMHEIVEANREYNSFIAMMTVTTGSIAKSRQEFDFVTKAADTFGVKIGSLTGSYAKLAAATKGLLTERNTKELFTAVTAVSSVLHAETYVVERMFNAFIQMASKGQIHMEELKQQLGEHLPGAMAIAATSMNMKIGDMIEAMKKGEISAKQLLEPLPKFLMDKFGAAADISAKSLHSTLNRFSNTYKQIMMDMSTNGIAAGLAATFESVNAHAKNATPAFQAFSGIIGNSLVDLAKLIDNLKPETVSRFAETIIDTTKALITFAGITADAIVWLSEHGAMVTLLAELYLGLKLATIGYTAGLLAVGAQSLIAKGAIFGLAGAVSILAGALIGLSIGEWARREFPALSGIAAMMIGWFDKIPIAVSHNTDLAGLYLKKFVSKMTDIVIESANWLSTELKNYGSVIASFFGIDVEKSIPIRSHLAFNIDKEIAAAKAEYKSAMGSIDDTVTDMFYDINNKKINPADGVISKEAIKSAQDFYAELAETQAEAEKLLDADKKKGGDKKLSAGEKLIADWKAMAAAMPDDELTKYTATEKKYFETLSQVSSGVIKLTTAEKARFATAAYSAIERERNINLLKEEVKYHEQLSKFFDDQRKDETSELDKIEKTNDAIRDRIATYGQTINVTTAYKASQVDLLIQQENLAASEATLAAETLNKQGVLASVAVEYLRLADLHLDKAKQLGIQRDLIIREGEAKTLHEMSKEWAKFGDDIYKSLTDSLYRAMESGKTFWKTFVDSLKNTLKSTVLKFAVQATVSTSGNILNAVINKIAGTSSSSNGDGTNYLGLASNANSIYNLYNGSTLANAQGAYNSYVAGSQFAGYTAPYWQTAAGAALANAATPTAAGYGMSLAPASSAIPGVAPTYGMSVAPTTAPSSSVLGAGTVAWVAAIVAGMYMSSEAWKSGIRWENYATGSDAKKYDAEVGMRAMKDKPMEALFGKDFVNSEFYAVMSGSALSAQIHMALQKSLWGTGYQSTGISSLRGSFSEAAGGFSGGQAGMEFSSSGGLFRGSNDKKTEWQGVGDEFNNMLDSMYSGIRNTYVMAGAVFDDNSIVEKLSGFTQDVFHSNTTDMKASLKLMSEILAKDMGNLLFPSIDALKRTASADGKIAAETWSDAFGRVMLEANAVNRVFELMGKKMSAVFGEDNADKILGISDAFISVFGTIDALNESFGYYYQNFYSSAEREAQARKDMAAAFLSLNLVLPSTREGFRALVDSAAQAGNPALYKALLALSSGFAALTPAIAETANAIDAAGRKTWGDKLALLEGTITSRQQDLNKALAGTSDDEVKRLINRVFALEDAASAAAKATEDAAKATETLNRANTAAAEKSTRLAEIIRTATLASFDAARSSIQSFATAGLANITEAINLEKTRLGVVKSVAQESVTSIKSLFSLLDDQASTLYGTVSSTQAMQAAEGSAFISNALANAQSSGYLPDRDALSSAISGARAGLSADSYATQFEADRAALVMAGQLSQLKDIAGNQLPAAEQAVKLADDQLKALDDSLDYYRHQLNQLQGINDNTLGFTGTIQDVGDAIVKQLMSMTSTLSSSIIAALKGGSITSTDAANQLKASGTPTDVATKVGSSNTFVSSKGAAIVDGMVYATNGFKGSMTEAKDEVLKAFNTLPPRDFQAAAISVGLSAAMIDQMFSLQPGQSNRWALENGLPQFAVGTNYVPRDMIAQIHEGEAIVPKAYNPVVGRGGNTERLESLVEALTAEVKQLQEIVSTGNIYAAEQVDLLDRVSEGGNAIRTEVMNTITVA